MIEMAIRPETIRLSIGVEHIDDVDQALAKATAG
jgi:O-acetylhomoserine/O-acetylserine sulfhydrylase-like pyridoxal-dependent enzyme